MFDGVDFRDGYVIPLADLPWVVRQLNESKTHFTNLKEAGVDEIDLPKGVHLPSLRFAHYTASLPAGKKPIQTLYEDGRPTYIVAKTKLSIDDLLGSFDEVIEQFEMPLRQAKAASVQVAAIAAL